MEIVHTLQVDMRDILRNLNETKPDMLSLKKFKLCSTTNREVKRAKSILFIYECVVVVVVNVIRLYVVEKKIINTTKSKKLVDRFF